MDVQSLTKLGIKHAKNHAAQRLYLNTGVNVTAPTRFFGVVTLRCNLFCGFCYDRRNLDYSNEMDVGEWQNALLSIRDFVGRFFINFSGGEVMLMKDFYKLMEFARDNGITAGLLTNGSAVKPKSVERLVATEPFDIGVSVDGPRAEIHDKIRGKPGSWEQCRTALKLAADERQKQGKKFPIIVRCVINSLNLHELPGMVDFVKSVGATGVIYQPVYEPDEVMPEWIERTGATSDKFTDHFWIGLERREELLAMVDQLVEMKKAGAPILNTERDLRMVPFHFAQEEPPKHGTRQCTVSLNNFWLQPNGDVQFCTFWPTIGNIREQSARDIWYGEKAEELRSSAVNCDKLCLTNCLSERTLGEKVSMALTLLKGNA